MDDGTLIIGNREQIDSPILLELAAKIPESNVDNPEGVLVSGSEANFTVKIHGATHKEYLNYVKFMKALYDTKFLRVHALNYGKDMFAGRINTFKYNTGFQSVEEEIDFLERICAIEDYFHIQMTLDGDISEEEYDTVVWVSKLITQDEVESKWSEATCTGILDQRFREKLVELDCEIHTFSYVGNIVVNLFGATFEFRHMRTYKCAIIQDFEKIKRKAEVLDDGDEIKIIFKPGDDNTAVDTLKIPDTMSTT